MAEVKKADSMWELLGRTPGNSFDHAPPRGDGIVEYSFRAPAHLGSAASPPSDAATTGGACPRPAERGRVGSRVDSHVQRGRCRRRAGLNKIASGAPVGFSGAGRQIPKARMPALPAHAHYRHRPPGGAMSASARCAAALNRPSAPV